MISILLNIHKKIYNNNYMNPEIWGPGTWTFLHTITFNYPTNPSDIQKRYYKDFFENLQNILPCPKCANHYGNNLNKYSLDAALESKDKLIKWLIDIHNEVNQKNNKKVYSYKEVIQIYNDLYNNKKLNLDSKKIMMILLLILLGYFIIKKT